MPEEKEDVSPYAVEMSEQVKTYTKLNLPDFVKPESVPVGGMVSGIIKDVIGNFTDNPDLDDTQNLIIELDRGPHKGVSVMFPATGQIAAALCGIEDVRGRHIAIVRKPDSVSKKYKNRMFSFDVFVAGVTEAEARKFEHFSKLRLREKND